jgi:hypothetical protein
MTHETILDYSLFIRHDFGNVLTANSDFMRKQTYRAHFLGQLMLYEAIMIPTMDFGIVPILINWLGLDGFEAALESSAIRFIRRNGIFAYLGNGAGLSNIVISRGKNKNYNWRLEAIFGTDIEKAIDLQIMHECSCIEEKHRAKIKERILKNSKDAYIDNDFFLDKIANESYEDIKTSENLSKYIEKKEKVKSGKVNVKALSGIEPNQARILNQNNTVGNPIELVLRVAELNMEIVMASIAGNIDLYTSAGSEKILFEKLQRSQIKNAYIESFTSLLELNNIPDIRQAFLSNEISSKELWTLREKRSAWKFREWLRKANPDDARELEKAYVQALGEKPFIDSLPGRSMRFIITSAAGMIPIVGHAVSLVDNFFVDKWLSGFSPKIFLDELTNIIQNKQ